MIDGLCSRCGVSRDVKPLFRNGPLGVDVDWCCIDCIDPQYMPNQSTVNLCKAILDAPKESIELQSTAHNTGMNAIALDIIERVYQECGKRPYDTVVSPKLYADIERFVSGQQHRKKA